MPISHTASDRVAIAVRTKKRKALQKMGGRVTTVAEFLDLSEAEQAIVEMRLKLVEAVKQGRREAGQQAEWDSPAGRS